MCLWAYFLTRIAVSRTITYIATPHHFIPHTIPPFPFVNFNLTSSKEIFGSIKRYSTANTVRPNAICTCFSPLKMVNKYEILFYFLCGYLQQTNIDDTPLKSRFLAVSKDIRQLIHSNQTPFVHVFPALKMVNNYMKYCCYFFVGIFSTQNRR